MCYRLSCARRGMACSRQCNGVNVIAPEPLTLRLLGWVAAITVVGQCSSRTISTPCSGTRIALRLLVGTVLIHDTGSASFLLGIARFSSDGTR